MEHDLWPRADSPTRLSALPWTPWAYATVGPIIVRHTLATNERAPANLHSEAYAARAKTVGYRLWSAAHGVSKCCALARGLLGSTGTARSVGWLKGAATVLGAPMVWPRFIHRSIELAPLPAPPDVDFVQPPAPAHWCLPAVESLNQL